MLIDEAVPGDRNVINKEAEKILKCKDQIKEIQHIWNVKAKVISVIIAVTGTISKSLRQQLSNIPGKHKLKKLQNVFHGQSSITCNTNCAIEYAIRRVQVNQDGLKLNGTHQLLVYADDVNIMGGNVHTIKKNAEALVVAGKEIELEVNADKTKYVVIYHNLNAG